MPELKVRCPECDSIIGTGETVEKGEFKEEEFPQTVQECPHCGHFIIWSGDTVVNNEELK
jgi:ssDNA-binding Zn-finger/Zn-ribbon topoisomerase 1